MQYRISEDNMTCTALLGHITVDFVQASVCHHLSGGRVLRGAVHADT